MMMTNLHHRGHHRSYPWQDCYYCNHHQKWQYDNNDIAVSNGPTPVLHLFLSVTLLILSASHRTLSVFILDHYFLLLAPSPPHSPLPLTPPPFFQWRSTGSGGLSILSESATRWSYCMWTMRCHVRFILIIIIIILLYLSSSSYLQIYRILYLPFCRLIYHSFSLSVKKNRKIVEKSGRKA